MNAEAWENCLTEHYLRSDGPYGGTPITFIDATPEELAAASGKYGRAEEANESFLQQFSVSNVHRWLDGEYHPTAFDRAVPGYFRYLTPAVPRTPEMRANPSKRPPANGLRNRWSRGPCG